jgi:uncharacterized RDD family membrane protein YckC
VLDTIPLVLLALFVSVLLGGERAEDDTRLDPIYVVTITCLLAIKDGFGGQFLGKALCGLQVVDRDSNLPAKLHQSAIRNWFLALPFMALIVALTMNKGPRIGDGMAKTRVIWKRHRDNPVFSSPAAAAKVFE